jgi:hypothetical protein
MLLNDFVCLLAYSFQQSPSRNFVQIVVIENDLIPDSQRVDDSANFLLPKEINLSPISITQNSLESKLVREAGIYTIAYFANGNEPNHVSLCDQGHLLTNEPYKGISTFYIL